MRATVIAPYHETGTKGYAPSRNKPPGSNIEFKVIQLKPAQNRPLEPIESDLNKAIEHIIEATRPNPEYPEDYPVSLQTAIGAISIVIATIQIANAPRVGPTVSGDVVLEWSLADGTVIGICISDGESDVFPTTDAAITREDGVHELSFASLSELINTLSLHSA